MSARGVVLALTVAALGCGAHGEPAASKARAPMPTASAPTPVSAPDPLGPRPVVAAPEPFVPPVPVAYTRPNGMTVWLLERHALPLVTVHVVVAGAGSASDPAGEGGLAYQAANMLDEGAGDRDALALAREVDRLGATLRTGATVDYASAEITVLAKNLAPATSILGDVVVRPRMAAREWRRVDALWQNALKARMADPASVAHVVAMRQLYGEGPYGHPPSGTTDSAAKVSLQDVKRAYRELWRPDRATCVVVGDVTRATLDPLLDRAFGGWKAPAKSGARAAVKAAKPVKAEAPARRHVVVVDRPGAPQSVIQVVRPGVTAADPDAPVLSRANAALGGSFTSRLNQDLREEHGWSYGARSRFTVTRARGAFVATAAVQTAHTGEALSAMLKDIATYAEQGPTAAEVDKTRLIARASLVDAFEAVEGAAHRLARDAGLGLSAAHQADASRAMAAATQAEMKALAARAMDPARAVVVIVGPRADIEPQLARAGFGSITASDPEGREKERR